MFINIYSEISPGAALKLTLSTLVSSLNTAEQSNRKCARYLYNGYFISKHLDSDSIKLACRDL